MINIKFLSNLVKCGMLDQFNEHFKQQNLIPDYQSTYRENYCYETALTKLVDDIMWRMVGQKITAHTVIDLSTAFNMVDYQVLIQVLGNKFGIDEVTLEWNKAYFYLRGCQVKVRDSISKVMDLPFSVPQGSCSGANLYSAYASTLKEVICKGVDYMALQMIMGMRTALQQSPEARRQLLSKSLNNVLET